MNTQTNPPNLERDLQALLDKGVTLYISADHLEERGLASGDLLSGLKAVGKRQLPELYADYDAIWRW